MALGTANALAGGIHCPPANRLRCLAIAASTGGIAALAAFFKALPPAIGVPILITQHLPIDFMRHFAGQVATLAQRPTQVADTGMVLAADEVLIAPGGAHLSLVRSGQEVRVRIVHGPVESGCAPSADPMFAAIAALYGRGACALLLSGMGRDGLTGAGAVAAAGGTVLAQDQESSVVWGMPGAVSRAGLAAAILPPEAWAARVAAGGRSGAWT